MPEEARHRTAGAVMLVAAWAACFVLIAIGWVQLDTYIINVVSYEAVPISAAAPWAHHVLPALLGVFVVSMLIRHGRLALHPEGGPAAKPDHARSASLQSSGLLTLLLATAISVAWVAGVAPGYFSSALMVVCVGWSVGLLAMAIQLPEEARRFDALAWAMLILAIAASTIWHTFEQIDQWRLLRFGYADIGHFVTELENAVRLGHEPNPFLETRMGYHAIFFFYLLAPFYAVWRSPMLLMLVAPLALNVASIAFFQLAKQRSGSNLIALLVGLSWLALPSLSRLPYANTYGFQSIYLAVPWLAFAFSFGLRERWRASYICLAVAVLCEETVCGVAVGWGMYLLLFSDRRRAGIAIMGIAVAYLLLCTTLIIPHFASAGTYTRLHLFGDAGIGDLLSRLVRPRAWEYMTALLAPLIVWLLPRWRMLMVIAPTLALVLVMQGEDWLGIKYWHQSSMLPALFAAAVMGVTCNASAKAADGPGRRTVGRTIGLLVTVVLFHQLWGYAPPTQAYRAVPREHRDDPRLQVVERIRSHFPPPDHSVIATERLAMHLWDYRGITTCEVMRDNYDMLNRATLLVLDPSDAWNPMIRDGNIGEIVDAARARGFRPAFTDQGILVLARPSQDLP